MYMYLLLLACVRRCIIESFLTSRPSLALKGRYNGWNDILLGQRAVMLVLQWRKKSQDYTVHADMNVDREGTKYAIATLASR